MATYNVYRIDSHRADKVGSVVAVTDEEALICASQKFGDDGSYRVEYSHGLHWVGYSYIPGSGAMEAVVFIRPRPNAEIEEVYICEAGVELNHARLAAKTLVNLLEGEGCAVQLVEAR